MEPAEFVKDLRSTPWHLCIACDVGYRAPKGSACWCCGSSANVSIQPPPVIPTSNSHPVIHDPEEPWSAVSSASVA